MSTQAHQPFLAETGGDRSGGSAPRGTPAFTGTPKAGSSMPFPSGSARRKSRIVPFPGIGRAILLRGARNSHVATLMERHSRFCMLVKVEMAQHKDFTLATDIQVTVSYSGPRRSRASTARRAVAGVAY